MSVSTAPKRARLVGRNHFFVKRFPGVGYGRYMCLRCLENVLNIFPQWWWKMVMNPMVERICKKSPTKQIQDLWAGVWVCEHPIKTGVYNMVVSQTNGLSSRHRNRNCDAYESYQMVRWTHNTSGTAVTWGEGRFLSKLQFEGRLPELRYWTIFKI